jgi:hypothetical protein
MRISRQPSLVEIMVDQKQLENVEYLKYLGSMITNDARCTQEIKSTIGMAKAAFNKKTFSTRKIGFKFTEEAGEVLYLEHIIVWC